MDIKEIQVLAMHAVVRETGDYNIRYIFRWYSKTFNTPLHEVEELPLQDVLQHYFEAKYEDLEGPERANEIHLLLMTEEELKAARRAEDAEDADAFEFGQEAKSAAPTTPVITAPLDPIQERLEKIRAQLKSPEAIPGKETSLPQTVIPEGISVQFEDLDIDIDDEPTFGPKKKPEGII